MDFLPIVLGLYDDPEEQKQDELIIDLYQTHLAIIGGTMSGKSTLLKTLLIGIHQSLHQKYGISFQEHIYILDFSNDLLDYVDLPYVTACFDALQEENVRRLFKVVSDRLSDNIKKLPGKSYAQCSVENRPAHITFIIDGLNAFLSDDKYILYHDMLQRFLRDGLSKGLTIVVTARENTGSIKRLMPLFKTFVGLDLSKDDYTDIFGGKIEKPIHQAGRGIVSIGGKTLEFQACFPTNSIDNYDDKQIVSDITKSLIENSECNDQSQESIINKFSQEKMKFFHGDLTKEEWSNYFDKSWEEYISFINLHSNNGCIESNMFTAGIDYYSFNPIAFDLIGCRAIAIYGKKSFGKTNLLSLILEQFIKMKDVNVFYWEDRRNGLIDPARAATVCDVLQCEHIEPYIEYDEENFFNMLKNYFEQKKNLSEIRNEISQAEQFSNSFFSQEEEMPSDIISEFSNESFEDINIDGTINQDGNKSIDNDCYKDIKLRKYTIIVIQSRNFYDISDYNRMSCVDRISKWIIDVDYDYPTLFVFSDVQPIADKQISTRFNNFIDYAFLMDDIVKFIQNRGCNSVFATQDIDDLKERYGSCEVGDGFFIDCGKTELYKLKFIKQE